MKCKAFLTRHSQLYSQQNNHNRLRDLRDGHFSNDDEGDFENKQQQGLYIAN